MKIKRLTAAGLIGLLLLSCSNRLNAVDREVPMHIEFTTEGGVAYFPGLNKPVIIDSRQLSETEAAELKRRVEAARFFTLPAQIGKPAPGAADYYQYTVTIEADSRRHTVHIVEPMTDANLRELVGFLKARAKMQRAH
jgi:hypothetical protein